MSRKPTKKPSQPPASMPIPESAAHKPDDSALLSGFDSDSVEDVDDLLAEDEFLADDEPEDVLIPPDLLIEDGELAEIEKEEPLDLLKDPALIMELGEDPVRLYLKEIGEIELLGVDKEFWLATRIEAARRIEALSKAHPLARKGVAGAQGDLPGLI